jgi:hypothetical protein
MTWKKRALATGVNYKFCLFYKDSKELNAVGRFVSYVHGEINQNFSATCNQFQGTKHTSKEIYFYFKRPKNWRDSLMRIGTSGCLLFYLLWLTALNAPD